MPFSPRARYFVLFLAYLWLACVYGTCFLLKTFWNMIYAKRREAAKIVGQLILTHSVSSGGRRARLWVRRRSGSLTRPTTRATKKEAGCSLFPAHCLTLPSR